MQKNFIKSIVLKMKLGFAFIFPWKETWTTTQFNVLFPALEQNDLWKRWNLFATFTVHESLRSNETNWAVKTFVERKVKERKKESEVAQSYPTVCNPVDCSLPGSSVHGILQARTLEWVTISSSRGSSRPRDWNCVSCTAGVFFTTEPSGKHKNVHFSQSWSTESR